MNPSAAPSLTSRFQHQVLWMKHERTHTSGWTLRLHPVWLNIKCIDWWSMKEPTLGVNPSADLVNLSWKLGFIIPRVYYKLEVQKGQNYWGTRDLPGEGLVITFFMQGNFCTKLQQMLFLSQSTVSNPHPLKLALNEGEGINQKKAWRKNLAI